MAKKGTKLESTFSAYFIERHLGAGGSGQVFEVRNEEGQAFAAKLLDSAKATSDKRKRFKNEINFCQANTHKNIIRVVDYGLSDEREPFYVMPLYGSTFRTLLKQGIPAAEVLPLFAQMLDGVEAAHLKRVCHRDLKPENVLVGQQGELAIADFGIARFNEEDLFTAVETRNHDRLANFLYSAPEQRVRGGTVGNTADIFALGLMLNESFTGIVPQGTGFNRIGDTATAYSYLDAIVERMIQHDPTKRPQSIAEVKAELAARGVENMAAQRLSSLKSEVISETEVDDPLVENPVQITGVDYSNGALQIRITPVPNRQWIQCFANPESHTFVGNISPRGFWFNGGEARIDVMQGWEQRAIDLFKDYLGKANIAYKKIAVQQHQAAIEEERKQHLLRVAAEEARKRVLSTLKW